MAAPVVHFEINCRDARKMQQFYRDIFDWNVDTSSMEDYGMVEPSPPGIGGGIAEGGAGGAPSGVIIYAGVDDLEATLQKVASLGGKTLVPPTEVPGIVTFAVFEDPEGHAMGIVKNEEM